MNLLQKLDPNLSALRPYEPGRPIEEVARELGLDPDSIVKLASNESALGPSPKAMQALEEAIGECHLYPDGGAWELRQALSEEHGVAPEQLILGNGSNEILEFVGHCFMRGDTHVVFSAHAFVVYRLLARMFGCKSTQVPMGADLRHDLDAMATAIQDDTSVVFVCNPNNPTGTAVAADEFERFCECVPEDVLIVLDEAYAEIALTLMPPSMDWVERFPNLLVCRSFSKAYGLAGLRIGYGVACQELATALGKVRQPFNTNRLAQQAAVAALSDQAFVTSSRELYRSEKNFFEQQLTAMGVSFLPTAANFILIQVDASLEPARRLRENGIIVRPMEVYDLPNHIRITFGTRTENLRCLNALRDLLAES